MIAEAWKDENKWIENTGGVQPVNNEILVDVIIDGEKTKGDRAGSWSWDLDEEYHITHWRLHTPLDTILPEPTRPAPAMPYVKPSKPEPSNVLVAFNRMTGRDLTEDELNTLRILMDVFGEK